MPLKVRKRGLHRFLKRQQAGKVSGGEDVTVHLAAKELPLSKPARLLGPPVKTACKGQLPRREPRPELLRGVRGALIEKPMADVDARTQSAWKESQQECFAIGQLLSRPRWGEGQAAGHDQGPEEWPRPPSFIAIGHRPSFSRCRGCGGGDPRACLTGGFFISPDGARSWGLPDRGLSGEIAPRRGFLDKRRSGGGRPSVIPPGLALLCPPPATARPRRESLADLVFHGPLR
jgi:hypothetical protein